MPAPLPEPRRAAIEAAIRAGEKSCRAIAREHGVAPSTVKLIATRAGIEGAFERSQTKKATEAHQADHQAALARIAGRHAKLAEAILDSYEDMTVDDWSDVSPHTRGIVLGIASDKARELAPIDTEGISAVDAWLRHTLGIGSG